MNCSASNKSLGTFFELGSGNAMECLASSGLDYVIIDMEHGHFTIKEVAEYIRIAEGRGVLPYVRIGDVERESVLQMLDIGARGIIVPNITSLEQVKKLISHGKFPPVGNRGFCPNRTTVWDGDLSPEKSARYMAECNKKALLIPQCETVEALEQIEEITALEGVDGIFIGPCDLSISMGIPLEFDSPKLHAAIERILNACKKNNKLSVIFAGDAEAANGWFHTGFDSVACGLDAAMYKNAYTEMVRQCKE